MITITILLIKSFVTNLVLYFFLKKSKDAELLYIAKDVVMFKEHPLDQPPQIIRFLRQYIIGRYATSFIVFILLYILLLLFVTIKAIVLISFKIFRIRMEVNPLS